MTTSVGPILRVLDRPMAPAVVTLLGATVVLLVMLRMVGDDPSRFVHAALPWADPSAVPPGLAISPVRYDGQFYYRLALDPFTAERTAYGITLDLPAYRQQRILYPLLAWLGAAGEVQRVPLSLIFVNLAGLGLIGWAGGMLAHTAGRHALWGLLFSTSPGFVLTLNGDLTEIVAAAPLVLALLLLRRGRAFGAGLSLVVAVLARETTAIASIAVAMSRAIGARLPPAQWLPFAVPVAVLFAWQSFLAARWGAVPVDVGASALDPPFLGLLAAAWLNAERFSVSSMLKWLVLLGFVLTTIALAAKAYSGSASLPHEKLAWLGYLGLATVLEANIWANGAMLRVLAEMEILAALLVLGAAVRLRAIFLASNIALVIFMFAVGLEV